MVPMLIARSSYNCRYQSCLACIRKKDTFHSLNVDSFRIAAQLGVSIMTDMECVQVFILDTGLKKSWLFALKSSFYKENGSSVFDFDLNIFDFDTNNFDFDISIFDILALTSTSASSMSLIQLQCQYLRRPQFDFNI